MNLQFNTRLSEGYKSSSQVARVLTEDWVLNNSYCPRCGNIFLKKFENNRPVADFYCEKCREEFELKSQKEKLSKIIPDGAYDTMISRIYSDNTPNFFFLTYSKTWFVDNFLIIPKHFFTEDIIIKRPPLAETARRAGWVGCNIDISKVPKTGKLFLIKDAEIIAPKIVTESFQKTLFIREKSLNSKGWIIDILNCVDSIPSDIFMLRDIYKFENKLQQKHPNNKFIKDKIRQQLQILRDKGLIEFISRGKYKKISYERI